MTELFVPQEVREILGDDTTAFIVFEDAVKARMDMLSSARIRIATGAHDMYNIRLVALQAVLHKAYPDQGIAWWRNHIEGAAEINRRQEQARS